MEGGTDSVNGISRLYKTIFPVPSVPVKKYYELVRDTQWNTVIIRITENCAKFCN